MVWRSVASTAPSTWRAILPVSRVSVRPPHSKLSLWTLNIFDFLSSSPSAVLREAFLFWSLRLSPTLPSSPMEPALAEAHPPQKQKHGLRLLPETVPILLLPGSAAQAQLGNDGLVALGILGLDVIKQATTLRHHLDHAAAGMIVLGVGLEVFGEIGDALRQDRDLHFRRAGIVGAGRVFGDQLFLAFRGNHSVIR